MAETDVLIIGTGIAGLTCAIKCAEQGLRVDVMTRASGPEENNTFWAQGGIIFSNPEDKYLASDIQTASGHTSDPRSIQHLIENSFSIVKELLFDKANCQFALDADGELKFTREAAHSLERIIFKGDYTGKAIELALLKYAMDRERFPNLRLRTGMTGIDLITPGHHGKTIQDRYLEREVLGAYFFDRTDRSVHKILAKKTVLASGGIGALYLHHSNSENARGDGHAMAMRAGAELINMEFVQFHPTTFFSPDGHRRFLVSEAVRGEGGRLVNSRGEAFMTRFHSDAELAPRDVVSRSIVEEMIANNEECVYLDITHKSRDWLKDRFPTIFNYCLEHDIDMSEKPIPVVPAAHYCCGGVKTDLQGKTNIPNLYAIGEVACTGLHGANRLASTSLLEGLTWAYSAAQDIVKTAPHSTISLGASDIQDWSFGDRPIDQALVAQDLMAIKQNMWNYVGIIRSRNRLMRARAMFRELSEQIQRFYRYSELDDRLIGIRNAIEVARLVTSASNRNRESIGCFYRVD